MADLIAELKALRLYGMASAYAESLQQRSAMSLQVEDALLRQLLEAERTDRGLRSIRYQMHAARFPCTAIWLASITPRENWTVARSSSSPALTSPR